ncbi:N-acetylglucosamine kinase [Mangrovimonas sp. YM274]|uniref:N-acetylglucosamine kinase n=1 Tax=Mangrovimonas sp. YM274 TaxID=3070660 RepID=UPI0027DCFD82|nr:N-acetylglucosamine kinase [Mangrovimonas sp. YM274]WMI68610.1 N-acetylglucosamine kinase [Mangrovimonas sp. YM274]
MVVIADSGSSKCDWVFYEIGCKPIKIRTRGLNPSISNKNALLDILKKTHEVLLYGEKVRQVYFYGAGCNTVESKNMMKDVLVAVFPNAVFDVEEDVMAAVKATVNGKPGVVCILGTGSNACYFDGTEIITKVPSLGYVLMDEGSGNYFGRELLKHYYYQRMPEDLRMAFSKQFSLEEKDVLHRLYKCDAPNKYLAQFAPFLVEHKSHEFARELLVHGFSAFIDNQLIQYSEELKTNRLYFVGSIAFYAQDILQEVLSGYGFKAQGVVKCPMDNLVQAMLSGNSVQLK